LSKFFCVYVLHKNDILIKNHHFTAINKRTPLRIIILLIPLFGNLVIGLYDLKKYNEKCFTLKVVSADGLSLEFGSDENKDSKRVVRAAVKNNVQAFKHVSERLANDSDFLEEQMKIELAVFLFSPDVKRKSRKVVFEMIKMYGPQVMLYAHPIVKKDKLFVLHLMEQFPAILKYTKLQRDKKFINKLIKINISYFKYIHKDIKNSEKYVAKLMGANVAILAKAGKRLRSNESFIQKQMQISPLALSHSLFSHDKAFITRKLKENLSLWKYLPPEIQDDWSFMSTFKQEGFKIFTYAQEDIQRDLTTIIKAIDTCELSLKWILPPFNNETQIILAYVKKGLIQELLFMPAKAKLNHSLALEACLINGEALCYFDITLINSKDHLLSAVKTSLKPLEKISCKTQNDKALFFQLIKINPDAMQFVDSRLKNDSQFVKTASQISQEVLKHTCFPGFTTASDWNMHSYESSQC
jgi:hypothetical protein